jgi:hypothetical protein
LIVIGWSTGLETEDRNESSDESSAESMEDAVGDVGGEQDKMDESVEDVRAFTTTTEGEKRREGSLSEFESMELCRPINGFTVIFGRRPPKYSVIANFLRGDLRGDGAASSPLVPFEPLGVLGGLVSLGVLGDFPFNLFSSLVRSR